MASVCVACGQDLSSKKKHEKVTLRSLPPEIISVWEELLSTQESSINPQNLLDDGSFMCWNCRNSYNSFVTSKANLLSKLKNAVNTISPREQSLAFGRQAGKTQAFAIPGWQHSKNISATHER